MPSVLPGSSKSHSDCNKRKATLISQASNWNRDNEQALTLALAVRLIVLRSSLSLHCSSSSTWVEFIHYESFPIQDILPIPLKLLPLPKPACFFVTAGRTSAITQLYKQLLSLIGVGDCDRATSMSALRSE